MSVQSRIAELSTIIAAGTAALDTYHIQHGIDAISFKPSAPTKIDYPPEIAQSRQALLEATAELQALVAGPMEALVKPHHNQLVALQAIYRFNIANSFPNGKEEATYGELAVATGLNEQDLRRILRAAMTHHIFCEPTRGIVSHTAASKLLSESSQMRQWIGAVTEELWPAAVKVVDALERYPGSQEPNQAGFNLAHSTEKSIFEYFSDKPARAKRFADAMSLFSTGAGYEPDHLLDNYPWARLGKAVMVDVGGSHGSVAASIARRFPEINCIVQDLPEVIASSTVPEDLKGRLSFQEHDFFTPQPIKDADVYYLRWVLHDWADAYAIRILRALIPAFKHGARLVISEYIVPDPGVVPLTIEQDIRAFDLVMMEFQNSKERSATDWETLFHEADARFKLTNIIMPLQSKLAIIEVTWQG